MCSECDEIDIKIARYRRLQDQINDRQTRDAAEILLSGLQAKKVALHPLSAKEVT